MHVGFDDVVLVALACVALACIIMWILAVTRWYFASVDRMTPPPRPRAPAASASHECACAATTSAHTAAASAPSAVWRVVNQPSGGMSVALAV